MVGLPLDLACRRGSLGEAEAPLARLGSGRWENEGGGDRQQREAAADDVHVGSPARRAGWFSSRVIQ